MSGTICLYSCGWRMFYFILLWWLSQAPLPLTQASTNDFPSSPSKVLPAPSTSSVSQDATEPNNLVFTHQNNTLPRWRLDLPLCLQNKTQTLKRIVFPGPNGYQVEVYLLGTAHVSKDSSRDVRLLLDAVEPSVLFLELCDQRIPMMLTPPPPVSPASSTSSANEQENLDKPKGFWRRGFFARRRQNVPALTKEEQQVAAEEAKNRRSLYGMASGLLTSMQQDYAKSLGVELGGEFRVAYNYWDEQRQHRSLHMILGDRPLYLTLTRAWESLGLWGKTKLIVGLLISSFQKPNPDELREWMSKILSDDTGDLLTESIAELAEHFPSLERVIIKERDAYMACKLYQTCRQLLTMSLAATTSQSPTEKHSLSIQPPKVRKLVAIVGAGHIQGMCRWLTETTGQQPEDVLHPLVQIKKAIPAEEERILIQDVLEVNYELLKSMAEDALT